MKDLQERLRIKACMIDLGERIACVSDSALMREAADAVDALSANAVQVEPVAYAVFSDNGNIQIWCTDPIQADRLRQQYGEALQPLYAAPQPAEQRPAPDVTHLVGALKQILGWRELRSGQEIPIERIEDVARAALSAYRKGGDTP